MKERWRNILDLTSAAAVVAGLFVVAFELRQSNRIARAQTVMELSAAHNILNSTRFASTEFARLHSLMHEPDRHEISEVDASDITGVAYYLHNTLWSAQSAYDNGILGIEDLTNYQNDLVVVLEEMPGLVPDLLYIHETQIGKRDAYVFEALAELAAKRLEEAREE